MEFPRVVAALAAFVGDIGLAEDLAQDALVDALRQWPRDGVPRNPGAWLTVVGKRRAVDLFRRNRNLSEKYAQLGRELAQAVAQPADVHVDFDPESEEEIADDRLRLMFVSCHPVLSLPARTALTLRLVGGLTVPEIARAYVVAESTIAQRIVRAKRTIADAAVAFEVPVGTDRTARLASVLQVIYLIYNEGYSATSGQEWLRPELCAEALRLGRVLSALAPEDPEVWGLLALMELQSSRLRARIGPSGSPVLLLQQDRRAWDRLHIRRGEEALARANQLAQSKRPLRAAGGHRRLPRPRLPIGGDRLERGGGAVRPAGADSPVADRRTEPGCGRRHGIGAGRHAGAGRPVGRDAHARPLPPSLQCARRSARSSRAPR